MYYTVYKITNNINGKYYIGKHQTKDLNDGYMGSGKLLKRAIKKHGIEKFSKEILHIFETEEEMNAKEKELVVISEQSYNLCEGGQGGFGYIYRNKLKDYSRNSDISGFKYFTPEQRSQYSRLGANIRNKDRSNETAHDRQKYVSRSFLGRNHSQESKEKISHSKKGTGLGKANSNFGKPRSEETKQKIRESLAKTRASKQ